MIKTDLLWHLNYMSLTSLALLCMYLVSLAQLYICHLILSMDSLSRDVDTHCVHYLMLMFWYRFLFVLHWIIQYLAFTLINKINQAGVIGGDCSRENPGRCAWKRDPYGFGCHTWSCYICALLLLHVTWYLSTVNCFSLLSGSTNASLVWYAVVLWDGAQDGCIS